jgi:glycosyltransferase involved in cell wall biosynthesis
MMVQTPPTLRIFHIIANARWTGPADPAVSLAAGLKKRGHTVYLTCRPNGSLFSNACALGLAPITHFNLGDSSNPVKYFEDIHKLKELFLLLKIDILHLHTSHDHTLGALAARLCRRRVRVIRTHHKAESIRSDPFHRYLYNRLTDLNVVVSQAAHQLAIARGAIRPEILQVVHGGVNIKRFKKGKPTTETRFAYGFKKNHLVLGLVSHVRANRRHMSALESFEKISSDFPNARLLFLGDSDKGYRKFLVEEVQRRGLEKKVHFILDKSFDWVQLLDMIDVAMVLAVGSEGSARAVLEAMALEKPVIGAEIGAIPEIVQNKASGMVVPQDDTAALADAMRRMLQDSEVRKKMGKAGRQIMENSFTNEQRAERMEILYFKLTNQHV